MEAEKALQASVVRYLHQSGGMDRLRAALVARAALSPVPKILKVPVLVNLTDVREADGEPMGFWSSSLLTVH